MQDEINEKIVALSIRAGSQGFRVTSSVLKAAMRKYLQNQEKRKTQNAVKQAERSVPRGKQTVAQLMDQKQGLTNIEITNRNIKSFERVANKYKTDPNTGEILKNPDGSNQKEIQEVLCPAFKVVSVFDVSQTDGRELPSLGVNELSGDVEQYEMFFEALKRTCPVLMEFEQISSGAKGYYHQIEQRIAIQEGMSQIQTVKTAIHEMAHQKLHAIDPNLKKSEQNMENISCGGKEVEAESVAYTVCQHYGIDTSDYSFAYIAGWSKGKETPELKASLNTIRKAASEIINDIDGHMKVLLQEKEQENTQDSKQVEAAYQIGNHYLEIHEASDGSWDYTLYGHNFREVDGGQISDSDTMTIEVAAKEVADFYQLYNQKLEPMDRDKLADLTELYNPVFTDEQFHFMAEIIDQGFDPKEYWVGGKAMDLTEKRLFAEDIADIKYQVQTDSIPRMLFTAEQWHEIEAGIADKLDVTVYARPEFSSEQMSILRGVLGVEYNGYLNREDVLSVADPKKSVDEIRKEVLQLRRDPETGERAKKPEVKEKTEETASKQSSKKKSLLADLHEKQAKVNGSNPKGQGKSKSKEME